MSLSYDTRAVEVPQAGPAGADDDQAAMQARPSRFLMGMTQRHHVEAAAEFLKIVEACDKAHLHLSFCIVETCALGSTMVVSCPGGAVGYRHTDDWTSRFRDDLRAGRFEQEALPPIPPLPARPRTRRARVPTPRQVRAAPASRVHEAVS